MGYKHAPSYFVAANGDSLAVKLKKDLRYRLIKLMSFRFCHFRRRLRCTTLRFGASDSGSDPRVLLELQEERPIGQGKLNERRRQNGIGSLCERVA